MKKTSIAILLISAILITSCKKNNTAGSAGEWVFGGNTYKATIATFSKADSSFTANSDGGSLTVYFPSASVQSGSYQIVNYDSVPLVAGHIYIRFIDEGTSQYYFSTGEDNVSANITVSSAGKINAAIPAVNLRSYTNPVPSTSALTASITSQ